MQRWWRRGRWERWGAIGGRGRAWTTRRRRSSRGNTRRSSGGAGRRRWSSPGSRRRRPFVSTAAASRSRIGAAAGSGRRRASPVAVMRWRLCRISCSYFWWSMCWREREMWICGWRWKIWMKELMLASRGMELALLVFFYFLHGAGVLICISCFRVWKYCFWLVK